MLVLFVTPWLRTFNQCWRWLRRHCRFHCAASFSRPWCAIIIIIYILWPSFSKTLKPLGLWWGTAWNTSLSTTKFVLQWGDCKWIVYIWDMKDEMYEQINKWMIKHSTLGKERNNKKKRCGYNALTKQVTNWKLLHFLHSTFEETTNSLCLPWYQIQNWYNLPSLFTLPADDDRELPFCLLLPFPPFPPIFISFSPPSTAGNLWMYR